MLIICKWISHATFFSCREYAVFILDCGSWGTKYPHSLKMITLQLIQSPEQQGNWYFVNGILPHSEKNYMIVVCQHCYCCGHQIYLWTLLKSILYCRYLKLTTCMYKHLNCYWSVIYLVNDINNFEVTAFAA